MYCSRSPRARRGQTRRERGTSVGHDETRDATHAHGTERTPGFGLAASVASLACGVSIPSSCPINSAPVGYCKVGALETHVYSTTCVAVHA